MKFCLIPSGFDEPLNETEENGDTLSFLFKVQMLYYDQLYI